MSIDSYRQQIEREIEEAQGREPAREAESTRDTLIRGTVTRGGGAPPADPRPSHEIALERLADEDQPTDVRLTALRVLKKEAISHPHFEDWRPQFHQALRKAAIAPDHELRFAALDTLMQHRDPSAQQALVGGLREPDKALLPPEEALRLLNYEPHAEVRDVAEEIVEAPPSEEARREALHILAADPGSKDRFAHLFRDESEASEVRRLAATALSSVAPETFKEIAREVRTRGGTRTRGGAPGEATGDDALDKHTRTLLDLME